jgi:8-oxo-dGTP pyrophosphatase MutT (NUDIX family)
VENKIVVNIESQPGREPFLALPGGRLERGEDPIVAAKRELTEETGYSSKDTFEWFTLDASDVMKIEWDIHFFISKNCQKSEDKKLDSGERIETKLVTLDELIEMREKFGNRINGLRQKLEDASRDEIEKQKLQALLGLTT